MQPATDPQPPVATDTAAPQVPEPLPAAPPAKEGDEPKPEPQSEPKPEPVDPAVVARWVEKLGSRSYEDRESARRQLTDAGTQVLGPVVAAAKGSNLEVSVRAMSIFTRLYERASGPDVDRVEDALDELLSAGNASAATRAERLAEDSYALRETRAVEKIAALGATIERSTDPVLVNGRVLVQPSADGKGALANIVLDPATWKGGDEGLKYVKRLSQLGRLYVVEGAITEEARNDLVQTMPNLDVQGRGKAYLGIGGAAGAGGGCFVTIVKPGTAAEKAGLQPGDQITAFGGKEVEGFPHLVDLIAEHNPGEKVTAGVIRNGFQKVDIEITLGRWADGQ